MKPPLHVLRTTHGYVVVLSAFDPVSGNLLFEFLTPINREKHPLDWREYENWRDNLFDELLESR